MRQRVPSSTVWSQAIGYSRAVRVGPLVEVSGVSAVAPDGSMHGGDSTVGQFEACVDALVTILAEAGATPGDVVRTRVFLSDIDDWESCAPVHRRVFGDVAPACSWFGGVTFVDPAMRIEIEATGWVDG